MRTVALSQINQALSKYLRMAEKGQVDITRHGKPAGILVGFASEEEWFEYQLENDPRFHERNERARKNIRRGKGVKIEDIANAGNYRSKRTDTRKK